jgi:hypothetical protein
MSLAVATTTTPSKHVGHHGEMDTPRAHGPLRPLLVGLTVVTGLVDAFSYLSLGHVFVANMTGNLVFLGFGLAGVGGIAILASLVAILAFALGALLGGRWAVHRDVRRGQVLAVAAATQAGLVVPRPSLPALPESGPRRHGYRWLDCWRWRWAARTRSPAGWPCPI